MRAILILSLTMIFFGSELFAGGHPVHCKMLKLEGSCDVLLQLGFQDLLHLTQTVYGVGSTGISVEQQLLPFLATPMLLIPLLQLVKPDSPSLMLVKVMYFGETQPSHFHVMLV